MKSALLILGTVVFTLSTYADSRSDMTNLEEYKRSLGFSSYYDEDSNIGRIKVAVLDKGFYGYKNEVGQSLPADTKYISGPVENPENQKVIHGLKMAQILVSMMSDDLRAQQFIPQLYLYNSYGYTNFKYAIDDAIERGVDVILYSEVWEYGGNHNGKGFINAAVNRATKNGILWVNAAGNFAQTTYNTKIQTASDDWVLLPDQNNALSLRCSAKKTCPAKIVLSWNDFKDDVELGTDKDLDFLIADDLLNIVQSSALKQSPDSNENRPGYSKYPREIIAVDLKPGQYFIRVKNRSKNFGSRDSLRITVDGDSISMPSRTSDETILNPADNSSVITVGASDSDKSSSSDRLDKPDILAPSSIQLSSGEEFRGSSNSAAIVAAGVSLIKSIRPRLDREEILSRIRGGSGGGGWNETGLSLQQLGFYFTGPGCFVQGRLNPPPYAKRVIDKGGILVETTAQLRIIVPFDPVRLDRNLRRQMIDDMIVVLPNTQYAVFPRRGMVPNGAIEVFQRPIEAGPCQVPPQGDGKHFYLP